VGNKVSLVWNRQPTDIRNSVKEVEMPMRMAAAIGCCNSEVEDAVILALAEHGFEFELLDREDDAGDGWAFWFIARKLTTLNTAAFEDLVTTVVATETSRAEVVRAGLEWDSWTERLLAPPIVPQQPHCVSCGRRFRPTRSDAAYCSSPCRQRAYRARRVTVQAAGLSVTGIKPPAA
jgi:hypothetical protein